MSQNSTVTCFSSPANAAVISVYFEARPKPEAPALSSGAAQLPQYRFCGGLAAPQDGQGASPAAPRIARSISYRLDSRRRTESISCPASGIAPGCSFGE